MTVSKYLGSVVLGEQCMSLVAMEDHGAALDLVNFGRAVFQSPLGRHFYDLDCSWETKTSNSELL